MTSIKDEFMNIEFQRCKTRYSFLDYSQCCVRNKYSKIIFTNFMNPLMNFEIWDRFEGKYMAKTGSSKKFLVSNFNNL